MKYALLKYRTVNGILLIKLFNPKYNLNSKRYHKASTINKYLDKVISYKNLKIYNNLSEKEIIVTGIHNPDDKFSTFKLIFNPKVGDKILKFDSDDDAKLWFEMEYNL